MGPRARLARSACFRTVWPRSSSEPARRNPQNIHSATSWPSRPHSAALPSPLPSRSQRRSLARMPDSTVCPPVRPSEAYIPSQPPGSQSADAEPARQRAVLQQPLADGVAAAPPISRPIPSPASNGPGTPTRPGNTPLFRSAQPRTKWKLNAALVLLDGSRHRGRHAGFLPVRGHCFTVSTPAIPDQALMLPQLTEVFRDEWSLTDWLRVQCC